MKYIITLATLLIVIPLPLRSQTPRPDYHASRAEHPPKIDGILDDEVWDDDPLSTGDWISYNPLYGTTVPQKTQVRIAYDDRYIYFAFKCLDSEPAKIRTTISRRDNAFNDDWVGFSLDSNGTGQTAYHLFVNPSGIQMDAFHTTASGERFEADFVWDSDSKMNEDGYSVEVRLPLQTIRFRGGKDVTMGILFWRKVSRSGVSTAWPDIPPGQWVFNRHAHLMFSELHPPRLIELLPSITQSINQIRATGNNWNKADGKSDVGLSDEARMLEEHLPGVPVLAGANRRLSIEGCRKHHAVDVFVCDDAFQHWPLRRDLDIVAVDAVNPFGNGKFLPRGILREPLKSLQRAQIIVLTKTDHPRADVQALRDRIAGINPQALIVE